MFCTSCGNQLKPGGRFCGACGTPVPGQQGQVAPPPPVGQTPVAVAPPPLQQAPVAPPPIQGAPVAPPPIQGQPAVGPPSQFSSPQGQQAASGSPRQLTPHDDTIFYAPGGPAAPEASPGSPPEELLAVIQGAWEWQEEITTTESGYWFITNKRMGFVDYDEAQEEYVYTDEDGNEYTEEELEGYDFAYDDETEPFAPRLEMLEDEDWCPLVFPLHHIHSIRVEKLLTRTSHIYLYNNTFCSAQLEVKDHNRLIGLLQSLLPNLLILDHGITEHYEPGISSLDPRNPLGTRYHPNYSRGYVVAHTKALRRNPRGIDHAINAAIQDGILPPNFDLAAHGIGKGKVPPGVPCILTVGYQ